MENSIYETDVEFKWDVWYGKISNVWLAARYNRYCQETHIARFDSEQEAWAYVFDHSIE